MVCIVILNIFKGYFYGIFKIIVFVIIDIFEKVMRVIIVSLFIFLI